jgi:type I restriction-modification system DNA methylase subunit
VNECVLWETTGGATLPDQTFERWKVTNVAREEHMEQPPTVDAIYRWLVSFLHEFAKILRGSMRIGLRSPDQKFVEALESALALPIRYTQDELFKRYESKAFKRDLDAWMRNLGWTIRDDAEGVRDNIERTAKFSCYLLVNKLVFHEALLKRYGKIMDPLAAPPEVDTGEMLRVRLEGFFADARWVTGDYETVFGDHQKNIGTRIPFYADAAVVSWRGLIEQIHEFDFSKLDYEIIGSIFERLIGPEERHKYGQFYTRVEVVDLINSFCIHSSDAKCA